MQTKLEATQDTIFYRTPEIAHDFATKENFNPLKSCFFLESFISVTIHTLGAL